MASKAVNALREAIYVLRQAVNVHRNAINCLRELPDRRSQLCLLRDDEIHLSLSFFVCH